MDWNTFWMVFGFVGQVFFGGAFVVQWMASERRKRSHVPISFWYLRLVGSVMLLAVAVIMSIEGDKKAFPLAFGFSLNIAIYIRNLMLIHRRRALAAPAVPEEDD